MIDRILVPLDGSSLAECVLPHVVAIARAFGSQVTLLQVLEHVNAADRAQTTDLIGWQLHKVEAEAYLQEVTPRLHKVGLQAKSVLLEGRAAERIVEFGHDTNTNLIILSSHGQSGLSGWNVSSVVMKILLRAYTTVMIVRAYQPAVGDLASLRYRRLLIPLDCSRRAECVLPFAGALARSHGAEVLAAHVVTKPQMVRQASLTREDVDLVDRIVKRNQREATRFLGQLQSRVDVDVQAQVLIGDDAATALHELTEQVEVDLAVLSAHGHSGGTKWPYGSVTLNFIGYGTMPLLIIQDLAPDEIQHTKPETAARERKGH